MFIPFNPNPSRKLVGDCVIRAVSKVTGKDWKTTYLKIALQGYSMDDMPSSNSVWGAYLYSEGFRREIIPNTCPDFQNDPRGAVQYMLNNGQMSQQQFNQLSSMAQSMGIKLN